MQKHRVMVQVLIALACATWSAFAVGEELEDAVVSGDETPYIDAEGNVDTELAKEYAETVDNYVDEFGTEWDVWLDEFGGQMWAESVGGEGTLGLVVYLLWPDWVKVWRDDLSPTVVTYSIAGTSYGYLVYAGTVCDGGVLRCSRWNLWATDPDQQEYEYPDNVYKVQGLVKSTSSLDVCDDDYGGDYHAPDTSGWVPATSKSCYFNGTNYLYYVTGDAGFVFEGGNYTRDYDLSEGMVRWNYMGTNGLTYRVEVHYAGPDPN